MRGARIVFEPTLEQKQSIVEWIRKWREILYLDRHHIDLIFAEHLKEDAPQTAAEISQNEPYLDVELTIYPNLFEADSETQERIIVHEMCHLLTIPLFGLLWKAVTGERMVSQAQARETDEHVTDLIAAILSHLVAPTPPTPKKGKSRNGNNRKKPGKPRGEDRQASFRIRPARKSLRTRSFGGENGRTVG